MVKSGALKNIQGNVTTIQSVCPFIDGKSTASFSGETLDVINPATGVLSMRIPAGCDTDVDRAVTSARAAFEDGRWSELQLSERKAILHRLADLIALNATDLDALDAIDMGKPISTTAFNAASAAQLFRSSASDIDQIMGDVYNSDESCLITQSRVPRGVIAAVVPWNFPTLNAALKLAPALAAGNCAVLKPSECSSRSAMYLMQLAIDAGLPPGVLNMIPGEGNIVGKALALHSDVDMITFTGSTDVGKLIQQYAGQSNMKLVHAECGGKSPQIVFSDFKNIDVVADHVAQSLLLNQGQVCSAGTRLLVQKTIEKKLIDKIVERFKNIVAGNPIDPNTTYGPLVNQQQMEKVLAYIEIGKNEGATVITGGNQLLKDSGGFYVEPTILSKVSPTAKIAQEEIFGPVLSVITFDDEEDAIRIANTTMYGLIAHVWTTNLAIGMRLAKKIRAGMVFVNSSTPAGECSGALSIEPYGQSGTGVEMGQAGLETYLRRQVMWFNHG